MAAAAAEQQGEQQQAVVAQALLIAAGLSAAAVALWVAALLWRAVNALRAAAAQRRRGDAAAGTSKKQQQQPQQPQQQQQQHQRKPDFKALKQQSKQHGGGGGAAHHADPHAAHRLAVAALRGHGDDVTGVAWAADGRALATSSADCMLRVFDLSPVLDAAVAAAATAAKGTPQPKCKTVRLQQPPLGVGFGNEPGTLVTALQAYPDIKLVAGRSTGAGAASTGDLAPLWSAPSGVEQLLAMAVAPAPQAAALGAAPPGGGVAVLLTPKKEARCVALAGGGAPLGAARPNSLVNHGLSLSADGRLLAVASFTSEVRVWGFAYDRDNRPKHSASAGPQHLGDLKGHTSAVTCVALSPDGRRAATASRDGTLRVWDCDVRWHLQEDARCKLQVPLRGAEYSLLAFGPDGVVAAARGDHVDLIDADGGGALLETLQHAHERGVVHLQFAPCRVRLGGGGGEPAALLATAGGDRKVRVWRSPRGAPAAAAPP